MEQSTSESCEDSFLVGYQDTSSYVQDALRSILAATKSANNLPSSGDDHDYYSTFPGFRAVMQKKRQTILSLMSSLIQNHGIREKFEGQELEEQFDLLVDVNDVILENASTHLDEADGLKKSEEELIIAVKPATSINTSWNKKQFNSGSPQSFKLLTAKNISRPQLQFKDKIDNTNSVFVPIIKEKPNSIKPLAITLEGASDEFCHPYEIEIEKFTPSEESLNESEPVIPKSLEETPLVMVGTEDELKQMCSDLRKEKEFAIDLEHHSYRSFQGFTCLMQISTRSKDYIIDVLALRSEMHVLNEVFTDPKIVKVLHGADMDIVWLQRDFGLYIVNMFDTGQAARVLHFAHLSLSFLLKHYCKLDVDKQFQLADWRIRPLPDTMLAYARGDTHYLLYVYDCIKNDLIKNGNNMKNLLLSTIDRSKLICAKKYQKPLFDEEKYLELYKKTKKILNSKQLYCIKELYAWRDKIARENDESIAYVLPNHMLLQIAEALPREQQGILACCNPIPPLVKQQLNELHAIVLKTNESSLRQLEALELEQKAQAPKIHNHIDLNSLIHCPHDIQHLEDKDGSHNKLPLIIRTTTNSDMTFSSSKPALSAIFQHLDVNKNISEEIISNICKLISPFERYKVTRQLQAAEELKRPQPTTNNERVINHAKAVVETSVDDTSIDENSVIEIDEDKVEEIESSPQNADETHTIIESTPLRKKGKKRKKNRVEPDISIIPTPKRTPELVTIDDESFTPYDYSKADYNSFSAKMNSSKKKQDKQNYYQTPRPPFRKKKKHGKQGFFGESSKNNSRTNWPKNKL